MKKMKDFSRFVSEGNDSAGGGKPDNLRRIKREERGDPAVAKMAKEMVGDGKEPNLYFVTATNDYMFHNASEGSWDYYFNDPTKAPIKVEDVIISETWGAFETLEKALEKAEKIELSEEIGPRMVIIEDRKSGMIYERALKAEMKVIWQEETLQSPKK